MFFSWLLLLHLAHMQCEQRGHSLGLDRKRVWRDLLESCEALLTCGPLGKCFVHVSPSARPSLCCPCLCGLFRLDAFPRFSSKLEDSSFKWPHACAHVPLLPQEPRPLSSRLKRHLGSLRCVSFVSGDTLSCATLRLWWRFTTGHRCLSCTMPDYFQAVGGSSPTSIYFFFLNSWKHLWNFEFSAPELDGRLKQVTQNKGF